MAALIQLLEMSGFPKLMPTRLIGKSTLNLRTAIKQPSIHVTACTSMLKWALVYAMHQPPYTGLINLVTSHLNWKTLLAFLDNVLILGKTFEDHLGNLGEALRRFGSLGLKLKAKTRGPMVL